MPENNYTVTWSIDDDLSTSPEQAAHAALRTLHDTYAENPDRANVFSVVDHISDILHTIDLGDTDNPDAAARAVWPRPDGARFTARLGRADAKLVADNNGYATLLVRVDQSEYLNAYAKFLINAKHNHYDLAHAAAFDFGTPYAAAITIIAVDVATNTFVLEYTTDIDTVIGRD